MAKRGRPKVGKTVSIRVPEDIYLMITWLAAAQRRSAVRVADDLWTHLAEEYFEYLDVIKRLKESEDKQAEEEGRQPLPLPSGIRTFNQQTKKMVPLHEFDFDKYDFPYLGKGKAKPLLAWDAYDSFEVEWNAEGAEVEKVLGNKPTDGK